MSASSSKLVRLPAASFCDYGMMPMLVGHEDAVIMDDSDAFFCLELTAPNHDPERDSWLAELPDGSAVGWAYVDNPTRSTVDNVEVYARPEYHSLYKPLLDRALARATERDAVILRAGTITAETDYIQTLLEAGFSFVRRHARMRIKLDDNRQPNFVVVSLSDPLVFRCPMLFMEDVGTASNAGAVSVLPGSGAGLTSTGGRLFTQASPGVPGTPETFDQFGGLEVVF